MAAIDLLLSQQSTPGDSFTQRTPRPKEVISFGLGVLGVLAVQFYFFLFVARIMMRPPFGPGTAPRTRMRWLSASILTTSRLRTVTRSLPYWPAMRMPFLGRPLPRL